MKRIALLLLLLAGCGKSYHDPGTPYQPAPPPQAADAYTTLVANVTGSAPDDAEPVSIDAMVATAPDDTEPQTV